MEARWIILGEDGRHVSLSRADVPTELELAEAEKMLRSQGLSGWLVELNGDYWVSKTRPRLTEVRPLSAPSSRFQDAVRKFEEIRQRQRDLVLSKKAS
jgi:hypothetical protein